METVVLVLILVAFAYTFRSLWREFRAEVQRQKAVAAEHAEQLRLQAQRARAQLVAEEEARRQALAAEEEARKKAAEQRQADRLQRSRELRDHVIASVLNEIFSRQRQTVEQFVRLAERKVGSLDDYGDENWAALPREISRCIHKIADREGLEVVDEACMLSWSNDPLPTVIQPYNSTMRQLERHDADTISRRLYDALHETLDRRFRSSYEERRDKDFRADEIAAMRGVEFENYLMGRLKENGFSVQGTKVSGDGGADIIATLGERVLVIQAKGYSRPVGVEAVQEVAAAVAVYRGTEAWVITNSTFTPAAARLALANAVGLIAGSDLARLRAILIGNARSSSRDRTLFE